MRCMMDGIMDWLERDEVGRCTPVRPNKDRTEGGVGQCGLPSASGAPQRLSGQEPTVSAAARATNVQQFPCQENRAVPEKGVSSIQPSGFSKFLPSSHSRRHGGLKSAGTIESMARRTTSPGTRPLPEKEPHSPLAPLSLRDPQVGPQWRHPRHQDSPAHFRRAASFLQSTRLFFFLPPSPPQL